MTKRFSCLSLILFMLVFLTVSSYGAMASESGSNDAVVTVIQGTARVYSKGSAVGHVIRKNDSIKKDQEIKVAEKSRIEMRFPDGTVMRLSEKTHIKMSELSFNKKTESKNVKVNLNAGKLWAKVKKLTTPESAVEIKTSNAVAGVRGTVYRVNVEEDKSSLVRVYDGTVYVANPPREASKPADKAVAPHEVSGPHAVPPPYHEVSMEEWTAIVKAMQQISVSAQGVPTKPQEFDPKADADEWVKWNQELDKKIQF